MHAYAILSRHVSGGNFEKKRRSLFDRRYTQTFDLVQFKINRIKLKIVPYKLDGTNLKKED